MSVMTAMSVRDDSSSQTEAGSPRLGLPLTCIRSPDLVREQLGLVCFPRLLDQMLPMFMLSFDLHMS